MIPKPDGSQRELGIPTVTDRLIQQALLQVPQALMDHRFSEHSHGFRPGRRAHDAVKAARAYVQSGKRVVVDVDLVKFFDRVNHDILIDRLKRRIDDAGVIQLIRAYLNAGIMDGGVVAERHLGTPQGGPRSALLANVLLDEVDKALEARSYCFARYADDCLRLRGQQEGWRAGSEGGLKRVLTVAYFDQMGGRQGCPDLKLSNRPVRPTCRVVWLGCLLQWKPPMPILRGVASSLYPVRNRFNLPQGVNAVTIGHVI